MAAERPSELLTLELLERRRSQTWLGLWLAPLLAIVAQALLLGVLADERIGWLARAAVLAAALATGLAALWSLLRARAREVQYGEAIDAGLAAAAGEAHIDVRPDALPRPRRRKPEPAPLRPMDNGDGEDDDGGESESETELLEPDPAKPASDAPPPPAADAPPPPAPTRRAQREHWVDRWDRHLTWWAAGESHTKPYMAWGAVLGLFMLADVAAYLATV